MSGLFLARFSKRTKNAVWFLLTGLIGSGMVLFMLWLVVLGPLYLKTYREFLSFMLAMIVGIGLPSEITASESMRSKLAIIFVGCFIGCAIAYLLPELGYASESYILGSLSVMGFTASLFYAALSEIMSNQPKNNAEKKAIENRQMEHAKEQLRAYSELEQLLIDLLENFGQRYKIGVATGMRTLTAPFAKIAKIDDLLQKDAYLFDEITKNGWREAKLTIRYGVNEGQDIVVDVAARLQVHVKDQIEKLKGTLNLD